MIYDYDSDKYPRYARKYGLGEDIREEYLEALAEEISTTKTNNRDELDMLDVMVEELGYSLQEENPDISFIDRTIRLMELFEDSKVTNEFIIDLAFKFEDFGRVQEPLRKNDDERSYGTIVKQQMLQKTL